LIAIRQLADGDWNADVREALFGVEDLGSEGSRSDNGVKKRFGPHLDDASDELALGIVVKGRRDGVETRLEKVAILEAALLKAKHIWINWEEPKRGVRI
jgi:hypothetical protein